MELVAIGGEALTIHDVVAVARGAAEVALGEDARRRILRARDVIERVVAGEQVAYGVTTGFGSLATTHIHAAQVRELQDNLVRSHAVGLGPRVRRDVGRAAMVIRLNTMARGYSGVRLSVAEHLLTMLNADLVPYVPSRGSLGASGDLARPRTSCSPCSVRASCWARTAAASRPGPPCGPRGSRRARGKPRMVCRC